MVQLTSLADPQEIEMVKDMIFRHAEYTGSHRATDLLLQWDESLPKFVRVIPHDYGRVLEAQARMKLEGMTREDAELAAFELNSHDLARVGGK
jgi:glutamate synthase (ferredoxin)